MNPETSKTSEAFVFDKYIAIALVAGLIIGFIIGHGAGSANGKRQVDDLNVVSENASSTLKANDWLAIDDQKAGSAVVVSKITLSAPYWVAVRENTETSRYPYILGALKLQAGTYHDVNLFVSRDTEAGKKYDVIFYKDSPDFDYSQSMLVQDGSSTIGATFNAR